MHHPGALIHLSGLHSKGTHVEYGVEKDVLLASTLLDEAAHYDAGKHLYTKEIKRQGEELFLSDASFTEQLKLLCNKSSRARVWQG